MVMDMAPSNGHVSSVVVPEHRVIRVSKLDNWREVGVRVAFEAAGTGAALMRAVGRDSIYSMVKGFIHARSLIALRGLDLYSSLGYQEINIGANSDLVSAVVMYCFVKPVGYVPQWETTPPE